MAGEVAPGQLRERRVAVDRPAAAEPVADEHVGVLPTHHRPAHGEPRSVASMSTWTSAWPSVRTPAAVQALAELGAGERALVGERALDHLDRRARPRRA